MVSHTIPSKVSEVLETVAPVNRSISGYGSKIPTRWKIKYAGRWYRVYVMQYGNSGSAYIKVLGEVLFLDIDTEYRLR
jgi:hypothetical protein